MEGGGGACEEMGYMKNSKFGVRVRLAAFFIVASSILFTSCSGVKANAEEKAPAKTETIKVYSLEKGESVMLQKVHKTEEEWRKQLTPEQYKVTRHKATELACSGPYWNHHEKGVYKCVCCDLELFMSDTKFESGTGWPSFFQPVAKENVREEADNSFGMKRVEVLCARCDSHLGHVFEDGPRPTGLRFCINSVALKFEKAK